MKPLPLSTTPVWIHREPATAPASRELPDFGGARLIDSFGRAIEDMRISVTDRCNFRCTYCMPEEGMSWLPRADLLTYEEITRIATVAVEQLGIESIRLTGGEPTIRSHLPVLIEKLAGLPVDLS